MPEIEYKIWNNLIEVFKNTRTSHDINALLGDILTPSEKIMFSKRLAIALFLKNGYSYRQISHLLKVSPTTINRSHDSLKRAHSGYLFLDKLNQDKTVISIFEKIDALLSTMPTKSGHNRWKFLNNL